MHLIKSLGLLSRLTDQLHPADLKSRTQNAVNDLSLIPRPNCIGLYDSKS
jgi:hypothetical protein